MQVKIFSDQNEQALERKVNDFLSKYSIKIVKTELSCASAGPIEDQWIVTTISIWYEGL